MEITQVSLYYQIIDINFAHLANTKTKRRKKAISERRLASS